MREELLENIIDSMAELSASADEALQLLSGLESEDGSNYDTSVLIPETDSALVHLCARVQTISGLVSEFKKSTRLDITPLQSLQEMQGSIDQSKSSFEKLKAVINTAQENNGRISRIDSRSFIIHFVNGQSLNIASRAKSAFDSIESLLKSLYSILFILRPRSAYSFQAAASSLEKVFENSEQALGKIKETGGKLDKRFQLLGKLLESSEESAREIERLQSEGAADRKTIAEYTSEITEQKARIQSAHDEAAALRSAVKQYESEFKEFQSSLEKRNETFEKGKSELEDLVSGFAKQKEDVERLISRSEQMLSSATVSGLASNFKGMTDNITIELRWARWAFYFSILILFLSATPLLAFVLFPVLAPFLATYDWFDAVSAASVTTGAENGWQYFGQVLARIVVLLPGAWLVSFSGIRHSSLFRLREHYAYKYSMAVSVEGFQKQAPEYKQEIAASILEQLAFNPTDKLVPSRLIPDGKPPTMLAHLMEKFRTRINRGTD